MTTFALLNGTVVDDAQQRSAGALLGLTCFETIAVEHGEAQLVTQHMARLAASAATLELEPVGGLDAVPAAIDDAVARSGLRDGICRVSLHARGVPTGLSTPSIECDVLVLVSKPRYGPELRRGVAAVTSTKQAPDPRSWPTHVKAPSLARLFAFREAEAESAFEALLLDREGHVVSGARSNLFAVVDDVLVTPPTPPALPGIQRGRLLGGGSTSCEVRPIDREELDSASEIFVTFTGPGVVPVTRLDGTVVGGGSPGETTLACLDTLGPSPGVGARTADR